MREETGTMAFGVWRSGSEAGAVEVKSIGMGDEGDTSPELLDFEAGPWFPRSSRSSILDEFRGFFRFPDLCVFELSTTDSVSAVSSSSLSTASPLPITPSPRSPYIAILNNTDVTPSIHSSSLI